MTDLERIADALEPQGKAGEYYDALGIHDAVCCMAIALEKIATSVTPNDAAGNSDDSGGYVTSLTEAVMGVTAGLNNIASAIREHGMRRP